MDGAIPVALRTSDVNGKEIAWVATKAPNAIQVIEAGKNAAVSMFTLPLNNFSTDRDRGWDLQWRGRTAEHRPR